jgi:hypothetical protein
MVEVKKQKFSKHVVGWQVADHGKVDVTCYSAIGYERVQSAYISFA